MGCVLSKIGPYNHQQKSTRILSKKDSLSYQHACETDSTVRSFDADLQQRIATLVSSLASDEPPHSHAIPFQVITEFLLNTNHDVLSILHNAHRDIARSPELSELVSKYFDNARHTISFCSSLQRCLRTAKDTLGIAKSAVQSFHEEENANYSKTMRELTRFKNAEPVFDDVFFRDLKVVLDHNKLFLEEMKAIKSKHDEKLKFVKTWRRISNLIFVSVAASIIVCSIVAAAMAAPPVAAALAAAAAAPLGVMGKWIDSLWNKYQKTLMAQKNVTAQMRLDELLAGAHVSGIRSMVERLEDGIGRMATTADLSSLRGGEAVRFGVEKMEREMEEYEKCIDELEKKANVCIENTKKASEILLRSVFATADDDGEDSLIANLC